MAARVKIKVGDTLVDECGVHGTIQKIEGGVAYMQVTIRKYWLKKYPDEERGPRCLPVAVVEGDVFRPQRAGCKESWWSLRDLCHWPRVEIPEKEMRAGLEWIAKRQPVAIWPMDEDPPGDDVREHLKKHKLIEKTGKNQALGWMSFPAWALTDKGHHYLAKAKRLT